jgi:cytochrome P450
MPDAETTTGRVRPRFSAPGVLDDTIDYTGERPHDLIERLHRLRATRPAAWVRSVGRPAVLLTSYELVDAAFRDETTFPAGAHIDEQMIAVQGRHMMTMTGDEHRRNRGLVSPNFRARLMPDLVKPLLEPIAHELIDRFEHRGEADLVAEFTKVYPFRVIVRLLGMSNAAEEDVRRWALGMIDIGGNFDHALACSREFVEFVQPILQSAAMTRPTTSSPGSPLPSSMASASPTMRYSASSSSSSPPAPILPTWVSAAPFSRFSRTPTSLTGCAPT